MNNIHDPKNIIGMASLLVDDDNQQELDLEAIEKSVVEGNSYMARKKHEADIDFAKQYSDELQNLDKQLNINMDFAKEPDYFAAGDTAPAETTNDEDADDDEEQYTYNHKPDGYSGGRNTGHVSWQPDEPVDNQLRNMTNEEKKQQQLNKVIGGMRKVDDEVEFIQEDVDEDETARILEQIDLLKTNLESEGVNLDRIPDVNSNTTKKEAKSILRILQIKNDRLRYCDMFEEGILAVAYGLENVFDGKREWFGSKIDLIGWPETVKVKLRRMRYDTSSFVSDIMKGYNISHGWRIMLELLPSLFLYSRDRRMRSNDNLISDQKYIDAMQAMNN